MGPLRLLRSAGIAARRSPKSANVQPCPSATALDPDIKRSQRVVHLGLQGL